MMLDPCSLCSYFGAWFQTSRRLSCQLCMDAPGCLLCSAVCLIFSSCTCVACLISSMRLSSAVPDV